MVAINEIENKSRHIIENLDRRVVTSMLTERSDSGVIIGDFAVTKQLLEFAGTRKTFYTVSYKGRRLYENVALAATCKQIVEGLIDNDHRRVDRAIERDNVYGSKLYETIVHKRRAVQTDKAVHWAKATHSEAKLEQIKHEIIRNR